MLLALSISLWALVVGIRLVHLQVLGREFFEQQGTRQSERTITSTPAGGRSSTARAGPSRSPWTRRASMPSPPT